MGKKSSALPVHERFHSWQGEGAHAGRSAYFIRLFGCPVRCPWCDSAGTWHSDYVPDQIERVDVQTLARAAESSGACFVVVTGGEPAIHDLAPLTAALRDAGLAVHLETSGGFEVRGSFDWVTLSPKWQKLPLASTLALASEFKLVVENEDSIGKWIQEIGHCFDGRPIWLQPEWSRRGDPSVLAAITRCVKERGDPFRAAFQLHKLYRADEMDANARPAAPLGGDPSQGY